MEPNSELLLLLPELLLVLVVVTTAWLLASRKSIADESTSWASLSRASLSILQNSVFPSLRANSSPGGWKNAIELSTCESPSAVHMERLASSDEAHSTIKAYLE